MKRFISIISVFILLCSLTGCAQLTHHTPKATVNHFFKSLKTYDTEQLAQYLTVFPDAKDTDKTYDPFSDKPYVELYQKAYVDLSYEIVSITQNGDSNATVVVKVKHPDLKSAYSTAFYASAAMIFSNEELLSSLFNDESKEINYFVPNYMQNMCVQGKIEIIESEYNLKLTNKDGQWLIVPDEQLKNLMTANFFQIVSGNESVFGNGTEE